MNALKIVWYPDVDSGPVRKYLDDLNVRRPKAGAKLSMDLAVLALDGLRSGHITIRPMGAGLWELKRQYDGVQYRIFLAVENGRAWMLHIIEKKSAKTPASDLVLARKRKSEVAP